MRKEPPKKSIFHLILISLVIAAILFPSDAFAVAGINKQLPYQAVLKTSAGVNVADGDLDMLFKIYSVSTGGSPLWTGTHTAANGNAVTVTDGVFSVLLGSGTGNAMTVDFTDDTLYLGVTIGADPEMTPRKRIGASGYAFNADTLDGIDSLSFLRSDAVDTMSVSSTSTLLTLTQSGTGDILNIFDGATEVFTILDGGNVGIGTSSPSSRLHALVDDANTASIVNLLTLDHTVTATSSAGIGTGVLFRAENDNGGIVDLGQITASLTDVTSGSEDGILTFFTAGPNGAALSERMRIDSSGNVVFPSGTNIGVHTTSAPTAFIHLMGDHATQPSIFFDFSTNGFRDIAYRGRLQIGTWDGATWTERAQFDSNGQLGIGDTTPDAKLDLVDTSTSTTAAATEGLEFTITDTGVVTTGTDALTGLDFNVTRTGATGGTMNTIGIDLDVVGDLGGTSTVTGLDVNVSGADTNYAAIFQGGNVGIGTATPNADLHIDSGISGSKLTQLQLTLDYAGGVGNGGLIKFRQVNAFDINQAAIYAEYQNNWGSSLNFMTRDTTSGVDADDLSNLVTRMTIDENGNVGIGTASPGKLLHLDTTNANGPDIFFTDADTGSIVGSDGLQLGMDDGEHGFFWNYESTGDIYFGAGNAEVMRLDSSGNVVFPSGTNIGVHTTSAPTAFIHLLGDHATQPSTFFDFSTNGFRDIAYRGRLQIGTWDGATWIERAQFDSNGQLGIGATPDAKLDLVDTSTSTTAATTEGLEFTITDTGVVTTGTDVLTGLDFNITRTGATGGTINTIGLDLDVVGDLAGAGTSTVTGLDVNVSGADTNIAAIFQGGNVGIGTTSPSDLLDVDGNVRGNRFIMDRGTQSSYIQRGESGTNKGMSFYTVDAHRMIIEESGEVGIGTTTPSSKLDVTTASLGVTQTTSSGLALVNTTVAAAGAQQISPAIRWSGFGWKTDATAASQAVDFRSYVVPVQGTANPTGYLTFESSINGGAYSTGQLVLTSAGNVGIGTTGPTIDLAIGDADTGLRQTADGVLDIMSNNSKTAGVSALRFFVYNVDDDAAENPVCRSASGELSRGSTGCNTSSIRYKQNVQDLDYGLHEVLQLRPVSYQKKTDPSRTQFGLIAEEVALIFPEIIGYEPNDPTLIQTYDYRGMPAKSLLCFLLIRFL